ncbi:alcohol dehydrogenase [Megasphaera cerevisiae DSM 20462]|jgi:L-gulonate 5-dehydrogenase|uniref:Alcohol dehydrogenase n=1 Tax=Megasphaera cerevisiae DSM 20462 TaxID=1122219 RepID=A0A0J6WZR3_9FIRM|nr:zinc-binding alcohol dehydrogenase family protein [Megasphaera cerevisiae]KMO87753.1 alcohol dehydrogenase [Megasphaera cerevisiae DSM 20462]OKY52567.1 alcohol dehydrogenase [Megasphaera cerevisiae]SJZ63501.1 L-gulonate 5-dehydrogenase [Megasphaera cerevisiae DSM 20462]
MKAVIVEEPEKISVVEREIPEITANQVLLKVKAAGICGSDVGIYHGKNAFATYPRVVGHEFVGEVVKVGANVKNAIVGDHIAVDPVVSCGHCYACKIGHHNVCQSVNVMGVHRDGGYQEYVAVDQDQLNQISKDIPWEIAATIEPYSIGAQVAHRGRLTSEDTVLICGAGPIGLIILQVAKMKGAKVAILDIVESRLEKAKQMGADLVVNGKTTDIVDAMERFTNGEGFNLIYEATGNVKILQTCIQKLPSQAGRIVVLGFSTVEFPIRQVDIMSKELEIIGTRLNNYRFPEVIHWFKEGKVQPKEIVTNTFHFTDADKAFKYNDENLDKVLKIILTF